MTGTKVLLSRWQFGITITYHFVFVPLTSGLAFLVAVMQVLAYRTKDEEWERLTRSEAGIEQHRAAARPLDSWAFQLTVWVNWT
jgi:cytochrome bd ubiquinol oxidase subunit I